MRIVLDILRHDAPFQLAEIPHGEMAEIEIPGVDFCPNRIVPVVGVADAWFSKGNDVRFVVPPYSVGERVLEGFNAHALNANGPLSSMYLGVSGGLTMHANKRIL